MNEDQNINNDQSIELQAEELSPAVTPKAKKGFHPKRFLKNRQQKLYRSSYLYLIFCFLVPVVLMYICYLAKGIFPFFNGSVLVLDLNAQYVYFFEALRSFVWGDGSLLYSFSRSLGGEFMGIYAYYMASPLTYIVALFPKERIQEAVLCLLLLKTGLSGLTFGFYLQKHSKKVHRLAILMFSCMYALSSYAVVQQSNTMWFDALILLPIFTYALERLITERKYKLYVISLSAILVCNYYIGYMVCIFAILYFLYYYFSKQKSEINPLGEKLHFVRAGSRFALFSILSAAISAFMLIVAYYSLGFGKSDFSSPSWALKGNFDVLDFLTKFLPGSYDTVEPVGLPFVYCGLLALFMVPVYFLAKKISNREKIASAALIAVFLISFIVSPIDLIWHGFSVPNWINTRYSFLFIFFILILAYKGFGNLRQVGEKCVLAIGALIVLFVVVAEKFEMEAFINSKQKLLTFGCIWFSILFTVALVVLLCLRMRTKNKKTSRSVAAVLVAIVCIELCCNGIVCFLQFHKDVAFTTYKSYQQSLEELRPVIDQVEELDDGFYRMEKVKHRTKNDNMALGLRGITNSTSTLNASAISFVNKLGYTGRAHLTMYRGGTPFSDSLLGIKYVIDYPASSRFESFYTELDGIESNTYKVMQNPYALSIAYGVSKDIQKFDFGDHYVVFKRYNSLASALLGEEKAQKLFLPVYGMQASGRGCEVTSTASYVKCKTEETVSGTLTFTYTAPYSGEYYFYSPVDSAEEMTFKVNGEGIGNYMGRDTNHVMHVGYHEKGSIIKIELGIPKNTSSTFQSKYEFLWCMDSAVYDDVMTRLMANPQFNIDTESEEDHIFGNITTAEADQMIMTTIPYDDGWKVYVDGEQVEIYETLEALMAFDIADSGEHTLELKYMPDCYKTGVIISLIGISTFVLLCAAEFILKKTPIRKYLPASRSPELWELEDFEDEEAPYTTPNLAEDVESATDENTHENEQN